MTANPNIRLASKTIGPESSCGAPGSAAADLTRAAIEQLICLGEVDGPFRGLEGRQEAAGADCEMGSLDLQVRRTMAQARIAAPADAALLIKGEKGTGKRTLGRIDSLMEQAVRRTLRHCHLFDFGPGAFRIRIIRLRPGFARRSPR